MLEFGKQDAAAPIKDITEADFMAEVVEASRDVPVIVDFWAPWCGPCKTLGPQLEAAVAATKGKVKMVKVNVDQNQRIASQMRVQSIPTVFAFFQGQPIDGFQGAVPKSEIDAFVKRVAEGGAEEGLAEAVAAAEEMLANGEVQDALQTFMAIVEEEGENIDAWAGVIRCYLAEGDLDQAEATLNGVPAKIAAAPPIEATRAQIALARQAANAGPVTELQAALDADPANAQARFDLAQALHAKGDVEAAVDHLLELFRRDREWNDGAAKSQLLTIFDALKPNDPVGLKGRRRLSAMIFA
ncbi:MAG TPA: thioredoxin [Rhodobacteraceae bacterium]|mgnify:CR=1 FL=1|jgi:putative thioredoxin|nr:thioredoxin [Paracoccaceae bacterium]HBV56105.1 thioredoxin [Paracoccaceae bacterium]